MVECKIDTYPLSAPAGFQSSLLKFIGVHFSTLANTFFCIFLTVARPSGEHHLSIEVKSTLVFI
jgi:hypothetical protein